MADVDAWEGDAARLGQGEPRTDRGRRRREAIVEVAREHFLRQGYAAASISSIASQAGGSKATLYAYFTTKAELFEAVIADLCERGRLELSSEMDASPPELAAVLTRLGRAYVQLVLSEDFVAMHRLVVAESVRFPELGRAFYEVGPKLSKADLATRLQSFIALGQLTCCDPERAAGQFFDLCLSGVYRRRLWNLLPPVTVDDMESNVDAAVKMMLAGYKGAIRLSGRQEEAVKLGQSRARPQ